MAEDEEAVKRVVKKRVVKKAAPSSPTTPPSQAPPSAESTNAPAPPKPAVARRRPHIPKELPALPGVEPRTALALSGAVVGLVAVGLTVLLMFVFELVRGTSTGNGFWGFVSLVIVLVLSVAAGSFLLASLHVPQARLTALVGALLVLIVVLAALLDVVFSAWMWLVIPTLSALAYLATHWVLSRAEA